MTARVAIGPAEYDGLTGRLYSHGAVVASLTGQENRILTLMVRCRGCPLSAERAFQIMYAHRVEPLASGPEMVRVFVSTLRRKRRKAGVLDAIETRRGYGWILRPQREIACEG